MKFDFKKSKIYHNLKKKQKKQPLMLPLLLVQAPIVNANHQYNKNILIAITRRSCPVQPQFEPTVALERGKCCFFLFLFFLSSHGDPYTLDASLKAIWCHISGGDIFIMSRFTWIIAVHFADNVMKYTKIKLSFLKEIVSTLFTWYT